MSLWSPQLDGFFRKTQGCPNCGPHKKYPSNSFALNESWNAIHGHNGPNSCLTQPYCTGRIFPSAEICLCERVVLLGCLAIRAFPIAPVDVSPPLLVMQQQYHSKIDVLIDEAFKEMISSLVSKVLPSSIVSASFEPPHFTTLRFGFCPFFSAGLQNVKSVVPFQQMLLCPKLCIRRMRLSRKRTSLLSQFAAVLDGVLSKLSRYDEGTFFSSILSFTVSIFTFIPPTPLSGISFRTNKPEIFSRYFFFLS